MVERSVTATMPDPQQWGSGGTPPLEHALHPIPGIDPRVARRESLKARIRLVGSLLIGALAVLSFALLGPSTENHAAERILIWADDSANQDRTQGAPQQAVVNGWTGNELLDLISSQLDEAAQPDHRPAALLTLGVLLIGLGLMTTPRRE